MDYRLVLSDLKIMDLHLLLTVDNDVRCPVTLGDFQDDPRANNVLWLINLVDILWENKAYSICQILPNNDLSRKLGNFLGIYFLVFFYIFRKSIFLQKIQIVGA